MSLRGRTARSGPSHIVLHIITTSPIPVMPAKAGTHGGAMPARA